MLGGRSAARVGAGLALLLLALLVAGGVWVYVESERRLGQRYAIPARPPTCPTVRDPAETLAHGRHLAVHVALCTWCHGDDLGGREMADDFWVGRLHASNLTSGRGGVGARADDAQLARAIRHGLAWDGRPLLLMPSHYLRALSDCDVASVVSWVRSAPPVDVVRPRPVAGPLTRLVLVSGLAPELIPAEWIDRRAGSHPDPAGGVERHDGAYLTDVASCRVCHHADLSGGLHPLSLPGEPPPPDLRPGGALASWTRADFRRAMRTGRTPDGRRLDPDSMPWPRFAGMADSELDALWSYLSAPLSSPPQPSEPARTAGLP